jgi:hypothetical protein
MTQEEEVFCSSIPQLLKANINTIVEVKAGGEWIVGKINSINLQEDK